MAFGCQDAVVVVVAAAAAGVAVGSFLGFGGTVDQAARASRERFQIVTGLVLVAFSTAADVVASV